MQLKASTPFALCEISQARTLLSSYVCHRFREVKGGKIRKPIIARFVFFSVVKCLKHVNDEGNKEYKETGNVYSLCSDDSDFCHKTG